jgi:transcriptional regulator with XRE-family HTH domain
MAEQLFSALLKYWRRRRGLSQLDLALAADVSARHISFLESGRARPSEDMVLRLMSMLNVPLRDQNDVLRAVSFEPRFPEPELNAIDPAIDATINRMMQQQEPYPLTVMTAAYDIVRGNDAANSVFTHFTAVPMRLQNNPNLFDQVFDPTLGRPFIKNWEQVGRRMVARLHREALHDSGDRRLWALFDRIFNYPDVPQSWRQPDFASISEPICPLVLERDSLKLEFLTTITTFSAPQQVTLQELRIESYFPLTDQTKLACEALPTAPVLKQYMMRGLRCSPDPQ